MTTTEEKAYEQAEEAATQVPALLAQMAERLGAHAGASAVFGKPVVQGERTVVPVAQSMLGTGAGGGADRESGSGVGAGGGVMARPVGYIEITPHRATFVPTTQPWADPKLVLAYSLLALVMARMVVKILRG